VENVLFFPIWVVSPHLETDLELMISEIDKGNEIFFLFCNKDLKICDNNLSSDKSICNKCIKIRKRVLKLITIKIKKNINVISLKKYLNALNKLDKDSYPKISFKDVEDLKQITYHSFDIGYGIASSLAIELDEASSIEEYREKINNLYFEAISFYKCIKSIIIDYSISTGYTFNGRFCFPRAFTQAFIDEGITFYTHERGSSYKKYEIFENTYPHNIINYTNRVNNWWNEKKDPFIKKVIADSFFIKRFLGEETDYKSFTKEQNISQLPNEITIYKKIVTIYTSSNFEFDYVSNEYTYKFYSSQMDGIIKIINSLENDKDIGIFLREHPNQKYRDSKFRQLLKQLDTANFHYIPAESNISSYNLLLKTNVVITFNSTMGIEATYWGIPSILCSNAIYENFNIAYEPSSHEEIINLIKSKLEPISKEDVYKYGYYHATFGINFKYYKPTDLAQGYFLNVDLYRNSFIIKLKIMIIFFLKKYYPSLYVFLKKIKNNHSRRFKTNLLKKETNG
jgi:hypothetical protein